MSRRLTLALLALAILPLQAYDIRPREDVHETMTRAARLCVDRALEDGTTPADCHALMERPLSVFNLFARVIRRLRGPRFPELEKAVRWPDIPTGANVNSLLDLMGRCEDRIGEGGRTDAHINNGLLCNSHFGSMQFFHAQATDPLEPASVTQARMVAWAAFLFDVATGRLDDALDDPYCARFAGDGLFVDAMLPEDDAVPCRDQGDGPWHLSDLFTMRCRDPFDATTCRVERDADAAPIARLNATGALLHMIQDSYSQSHAQRGDVRWKAGKVVPELVCRPIRQFTNYRLQDPRTHSQADRAPVLDPSCGAGTGIDDPVTASARALWHIRRATRPDAGPDDRAAFLRDIHAVLRLADDAEPTGPGDCCEPGG